MPKIVIREVTMPRTSEKRYFVDGKRVSFQTVKRLRQEPHETIYAHGKGN